MFICLWNYLKNLGSVGSGKSSILMSILGEIPITSGTVKVRGKVAYARLECFALICFQQVLQLTRLHTWLYCLTNITMRKQIFIFSVDLSQSTSNCCHFFLSQEPWVFAGTIKENVLFGSLYNEEKYRKVLHVCALEKDMNLFPFGMWSAKLDY